MNRQRGSGTRQWFDRLLERTNIPPSTIVGYGQEEFTHQAVAAVIASGAADAGMGVRAVAERFGLAFEAVGKEVYFIAARSEISEAIGLVCDRIAAKRKDFPGYAQVSRVVEGNSGLGYSRYENVSSWHKTASGMPSALMVRADAV